MYLRPHPSLRRWISNYTVTFPGLGVMSDQYSVIPHGSATLVFSCNKNRIWSNLFGPLTKSVCVGSDANSFELLFIIEFQPAGYYAFCSMPQKEITDIVLPFKIVNPSLCRLIVQQLEMAESIYHLIAEVDKLFMVHLKAEFYQQEFILANQIIIDSGGLLSVKEVSQHAHYSERHLNRIFDRYMGVNIKSYSRLVRINKALRLLRRSNLSIMQVSMEAGFYDIPHFIHDFKSICNITPQEYRDNMSDFYSEIAKF